MYLQIFSTATLAPVLAFALVACSKETPPPYGDEVDCAIGAGSDYSKVCTLEEAGDSEYLIHLPDGGFRRLKFNPEAGDFGSVDGADDLKIITQDGTIAVFEIGNDRFRIPHRLVSAPAE